jgi:nucleoside-diphosphate-sugar epimerase
VRTLLTGASGFLGQILLSHLNPKEEVKTLSRGQENDFVLDIVKPFNSLPNFDRVIHCAGKAHSIPRNEHEAKAFFEVNVEGTRNLVNALKLSPPKQFILISTVAVYGLEEGKQVNESNPLLGYTPYAKSKILAEEIVTEWGDEHHVNVLILRLPLIVGHNPPGNLGKMIMAIKAGRYVSIGKGDARKSMILASNFADFLKSANLKLKGIYNLTDGYHPSFSELEELICQQLDKRKPYRMPLGVAKVIGKIGDLIPYFPIKSKTIYKITKELIFDDTKAVKELNWRSQSVLQNYNLSNG